MKLIIIIFTALALPVSANTVTFTANIASQTASSVAATSTTSDAVSLNNTPDGFVWASDRRWHHFNGELKACVEGKVHIPTATCRNSKAEVGKPLSIREYIKAKSGRDDARYVGMNLQWSKNRVIFFYQLNLSSTSSATNGNVSINTNTGNVTINH
ncbi:hypothetical protein P3447_08685 [Vibrio parahaemolyticus]|nr:hypothetical protein [Vibrio parahaemolyticus]